MNRSVVTIFIFFCIHLVCGQTSLILQTGHNGSLKQIAFSFDDQYIASIDDGDKIILWDLKTEKQFANLKENYHTVNSLCFHPNLPLLVSGGSDSTVLVWDYLNSKIVDKIKFSSGAVTSVMFSSDGSKLLVCANSLNELNFSDKQITFSKKDFFYQKAYFSDLGVLFSVGNGEKNFYASFNKVNNSNSTNTILKRRAFAPFRDGTLNFYSLGSKGNELTEYKLSSKNNLYYKNSKITEGSDKFKIIAIESSKKYVTVSTRQKNIFVYKAAGLKKAFNLSGHNFPPNCLAISNKEKWLASSDQTGNIFLWNLENGRLTAVLQSKVIKVIDASLGKDQKTLSLLYSSGELKIWNLEDNNIYSEKFDSKKFLKGESENYFPTRIVNETDSTLVFNVFKTKVNLTEAVIKAEAFAVTYNKRTNGYNFAITKSENYRSLLKRKKGRKTILETIEKFPELNDERYLTDFENNLLKNKLVNGIVNNFHSDALFLDIVIKSNGELELISNKTKKKIKSIIVGDRDFIYINDSSYYYASKGALPFLAFRNGENIYDFDQFDVKYNRPDVIFSDLGFINQNQIEASKVAYKKRIKLVGEIKENGLKRPPSFSLILPKELEVEGDKFNFGVFSESKFSQIKKLIVLVNGIPLNGIEGISIESGEDFEKQVSLTLENGKNYFQVYIVDFEGTKSLTKSFVVNSTISKLSKPNLYIVAIGVSDHKSKENSLVYAKKDAIDFLNKMKKNKIYKDVKYKLLFDSAATKRQIVTINEFVSPAKESDVFILFYAGHGVLDKELNYYLSTYSIDFTAPQIEGLSIDTLSHIVSQIKCRKKLVFIDACHSGEVDKEDIVINNIQITSENKEVKFRAIGSKGVSSKNLYDSKSSIEIAKLLFTDTRSNNGVNIISSAGGAEYAMEGGEWKNGVFTYALLNGIKTNEADLNKDGEIWVNELQEYLGKKVSLITGGKQTPTSRTENLSSNFRVW